MQKTQGASSQEACHKLAVQHPKDNPHQRQDRIHNQGGSTVLQLHLKPQSQKGFNYTKNAFVMRPKRGISERELLQCLIKEEQQEKHKKL